MRLVPGGLLKTLIALAVRSTCNSAAKGVDWTIGLARSAAMAMAIRHNARFASNRPSE
jgi:hypothetical protein